jgi:phosphatidylglycerol:prolipoprotein diacylglycerol transferase
MLIPPDNQYFLVFNFSVYYYGVILAVAIFAGIFVSNKVAMKEYLMPELVPNIATSLILGGIIGARLYYCLLNYPLYCNNPLEIFLLREGGLSIHGAILGGFFVLYYQSKKLNLPLLKLCDICSVGLPLAQSIGRWGNFFNSEAFGLPTDLPWKMYIKPCFRPEQYYHSEYFHPTFLYEAVFDFVIFIILYKYVLKKYKNETGMITAFYLLMYSVVRAIVEQFRVDCFCHVLGFPLPQIISFLLIACSLIFIVRNAYKHSA